MFQHLYVRAQIQVSRNWFKNWPAMKVRANYERKSAKDERVRVRVAEEVDAKLRAAKYETTG